MAMEWPLKYRIVAQCSMTKARVAKMELPHVVADLPMFMPVATSGVMKGVSVSQLQELNLHVILGNTYHLALQPGKQLMQATYDGLHRFMQWPNGLLTDSGGFQMVSLARLMDIDEEGVRFVSHIDGCTELVLRPEDSIAMQNALGSDIMMQLDDVVSSLTTGPRVEEAMWRSIRWLDRCIAAHDRKRDQNLFAIVQGGLNSDLRRICSKEMAARNCPGYAIGGLSGGESKDEFWRMVTLCTDILPKDKPRYCMGVGYAEDLVVCVALGVDMFDCVFPTRTARFGNALTRSGPLNLKSTAFARDFSAIEADCRCATCRDHTRAYINHMFTIGETGACHLVSVHNLAFQARLMDEMRRHITDDTFAAFVQHFMFRYFKERCSRRGEPRPAADYPDWIVNALCSVNIALLQ